jgi:hypothetical protein
MRLLPYLNREQYGERPSFVRGPHFDAQPTGINTEERYGRMGDRYAIVDEKVDYEYSPSDQALFPRMGDYSQGRPSLYRRWIDKPNGRRPSVTTSSFSGNTNWAGCIGAISCGISLVAKTVTKGYYAWDPTAGNWITGIDAIDAGRLGNQEELPDFQKITRDGTSTT